MTPFLTLSKITHFLLYRVQLTLFHSDEVLDDDYTLTDVAYITAWNAVSIKCILSTKLRVCDIFLRNQFYILYYILHCYYCIRSYVLRTSVLCLSECAGCCQQRHAGSKAFLQQNSPVFNQGCRLTQVGQTMDVKWQLLYLLLLLCSSRLKRITGVVACVDAVDAAAVFLQSADAVSTRRRCCGCCCCCGRQGNGGRAFI